MKNLVITISTVTACLALSFPALTSAQCDCADVDCDGQWTFNDAQYVVNYLFGGGPPPLTETIEQADWDNHESLNIADVWHNMHYVYGGEWPPVCPPSLPPLEPVIDSSIILYYTDWIPFGESAAVVALTLSANLGGGFYGLSLPLKIRVDGEIPIINSVITLYQAPAEYTIYPDSGYVAIGMVPFINSPGMYASQIALIHLTLPPEATERTISLEWVNLTPIQAPTQDSSIIPMLYYYADAFEPILTPHCCITPGDANMDGMVNVADAVYNLQCIFVDCLGHPCEKQLDANCDGDWNIADIVHVINYIFKGGDPPCCL